MALNDSDKLLVNDGSRTETITFANLKNGTMLSNTDQFLINDGTKTETITWAEIQNELGPNGIVNTPTVLKPNDGAGSGALRYLKTDKINEVGGGGSNFCETSTIENVDETTSAPNIILTFPDNTGFECFDLNDVVQGSKFNGTKTWSNGVSGTIDPSRPGIYAFNDDNATSCAPPGQGQTITFDFTQEFSGRVEFYNRTMSGTFVFKNVNTTVDTKVISDTEATTGWQTLFDNVGAFTKIEVTGDGGSKVVVAGWRIDGEVLLDPTYESNPSVKIVSKDSNANTMIVDGGEWLGSDNSGTLGGDTRLSKTISYDATLTLDGPTDLAEMAAIQGAVFMADGAAYPDGSYRQAPYKLVTADIESVDDTDPANIVLTFPGDVSTNPDLQYFRQGDEVQSGVSVISTGYPNSNTMVVDGGDWDTAANQDKVWSDGFTGDIDPGNPATNAFDGNLSTYCGSVNQGATQTLLLGEDFSGTLDFYNRTMTGKVIAKKGATVIHEQDLNTGSTGWENIVTNAAPFDRIVVESAGNSIIAWGAFRINGRVLVDAGINTPAESHVEYQTDGGQGSVIEVNTTDNTMKIASTGDRDNRWIADNSGEGSGASTPFYVAGPSEVDSPLLTSNVWLESSPFSTTPATDPNTGNPLDALAKITWSITPDGGDEMIQDAGTSNPYQPTGLTLDTWHTIKVKHEGLLLGESIGPWSPSTRFKTGLSRSIKEHYVSKILGLEEELKEAQAKKRGRKKAD